MPLGTRPGFPVEIMNSHPPPGRVVDLDHSNFKAEVIQARLPVVVAFETPWSQPCRILHRVLSQVARSSAGRFRILRINADDDPVLSLWYDIQSVPTLLYFVNGQLRAKQVGTTSRKAILAQLNALPHPTSSPEFKPSTPFEP